MTTTVTHFEARHRALREAGEATRIPAPKYSVAHGHALLALDRFEKRTGPLVDDLVAVARRCVDTLQEYPIADLEAALAALDEASRG
jgi:hypothetical protein